MFQYATVFQGEDLDLDDVLGFEQYPNLQEEYFEEKDSYEVYLYSFSQPSFLNPEEEKNNYVTAYVKNDDSTNYFILVRGFNYLFDSQTNRLFSDVIESIEYFDGSESSSFFEDFTQEVLGTMDGVINTARILGQSASVRIFARNCYDLTFSEELMPFRLAGNSYNVCGASMGTGFAITPYGDFLTNAHVIRPHRFDTVATGVSENGEYEKMMGDEIKDFLQGLLGDFILFLTEQQVQTFYVYMLHEMYDEDYVSITGGTNDVYIQGAENFDVDMQTQELKNESAHQKSIIIKSNQIDSVYQTMFSFLESDALMKDGIEEMPEEVQEGLTRIADIALVRPQSGVRVPSISFSPNRPVQGQDIRVVGYPGIVDEKSLVSSSALTGATVTSGTITGIQPNTNNTYDLIQIDASVESGNSGGPIISQNGEVLGMTTYALTSGSGNFNWGVSSVELKNFLQEEGIPDGPNEESRVLSSALADMSKEYYVRSQDKLEGLVANEPVLAITLNPLIDVAKENIELGNDKTPWIDLVYVDIPNWGLLLIAGIVLVVFILLLILIISKVKGKKGKNYAEPMFDAPKASKEPEPVVQQQQPIDDQRGYLRPQTPTTPQQPPPPASPPPIPPTQPASQPDTNIPPQTVV